MDPPPRFSALRSWRLVPCSLRLGGLQLVGRAGPISRTLTYRTTAPKMPKTISRKRFRIVEGHGRPLKKQVTLQDVAQHAQVGTSTVSKVLNGYPDVAESTRERVLASVRELEFRPNRAARSFRTGKTQTVSVFMPMIGTEFYDRLITAIDDALASHDYDAALFPLLNEKRLERYRSAEALPYQADALILASLNPDWLFADARLPAPLPAVLVDAYHAEYDTVTFDNARGAALATSHLLEVNAPTFAVMVERFQEGTFSSGVFIERHKGFQHAVESHDPRVHAEVLEVPFDPTGGAEALAQVLARFEPPLNVFASCDLLAKGVVDEARRQGLQIGLDVRVVGVDDQPWAEDLGLSTIRQPIEQMGSHAAELVLARLAKPGAAPRHIELEPTLVVRGSSEGGGQPHPIRPTQIN